MLQHEGRAVASVAGDFDDADRHLQKSDLLVTYTAGPFADDRQSEGIAEWLDGGGRWVALHGTSGGKAVPLPDGLLLAKEIEQRLGPSAARKATELEAGESAVIGEGERQYTIRLLERRDGVLVPFDEAHDAVEAAYLRDRSETAVREFLDVARRRTDIRLEAAP